MDNISHLLMGIDPNAKIIHQIHIGYINDVYLVRIQETSYVLKVFKICEKEKIIDSINLQKYLNGQNLSPGIVLEDDSYVHYILQEYFPPVIDKKNWNLYGETLGLLHLSLREYAETTFVDFAEHLKKVNIEKHQIDDGQRELLLCKKQLRQLVYPPEVEKKQIIHGDYTWNNVLQNGEKYSVIDFDEAKYFFPMYDVGKVILNLLFSHEDEKWIKINSFLNGYQKNCQLDLSEKKELFNLYGYTLLHDMNDFSNNKNKDPLYIKKRIQIHKNIILFIKRQNEILKHIVW